MNDRIAGAVLGAFAADSLALGVHWIYNPTRIARLVGRIAAPLDPLAGAAKYHPARKAGQFTHYGDQMLVLLRSVAASDGWSREDFAARWAEMWEGYDGYVDGATKDTLAGWDAGTPSESNDLAGPSRLPALLPALADDLEGLVAAAREQTGLTHGDAATVDCAEFFAVMIHATLHGATIHDALAAALDRDYAHLPAGEWLELARGHLDAEDPAAVVKELGADCHVPHAFPATLYLLLKFGDSLEDTLVENTMAGGDSAARGMLLGAILGARDGTAAIPGAWLGALEAGAEIRKLMGQPERPPAGPSKFSFQSADGLGLAGRLEAPEGDIKGFAVFAHCFTCGKDVAAATRIARGLAAHGVAVLRFDFTGLGNSDGDFANTDFSSNVADLAAAADALRSRFEAPRLLVGHSLGGAAVLAAAQAIPEVTGVVTIGAPADPAHVEHLLKGSLEEIERDGAAPVELAGRSFTIRREFLHDVRDQLQFEKIAGLRRALLIMHSPVDTVVGVDNARQIFEAARHPKSFLSLDQADHLLSKRADSEFVAAVIAAWGERLLA